MKKSGFSLIELLIVVSIIAIIGAIGSGLYLNYGKNIEIKSVAQTMSYDLKQVQSRAMIGEGNLKWGIHFANSSSDFYELFSTPTDYSDGSKVIISKNYLSKNITFSDPVESATKDIIFNKISGGTTTSSISIISNNITKIISVSSIGNISVQ